MELWLEAEIRLRRDDAHAFAKRVRRVRLCRSGRSTSVRATMADGAQCASDALAHLAAMLRGVSPAGSGVTIPASDRRGPPEPRSPKRVA